MGGAFRGKIYLKSLPVLPKRTRIRTAQVALETGLKELSMQFLVKAGRFLSTLQNFAMKNGRRIERSNAKTICYIKRLSSVADGELRRIVREESASLLRDTAKIRAAKFILCHRG